MKSGKRDSEKKEVQSNQTSQQPTIPDEEVEAEISDMTPQHQKQFALRNERAKDLKEARTSQSTQIRSVIDEMRNKITQSKGAPVEQPKGAHGSVKPPKAGQ